MLSDKEIEELKSKYLELNSNDNLWMIYDKEELEEEIRDSMFDDGFKKGEKSGINQSKIEIAKKMLEKNLDIKTIFEVTGLSKEEIEKL